MDNLGSFFLFFWWYKKKLTQEHSKQGKLNREESQKKGSDEKKQSIEDYLVSARKNVDNAVKEGSASDENTQKRK